MSPDTARGEAEPEQRGELEPGDDPGTPDVGDRVTIVDAHGRQHEAICTRVHGVQTIDAVFNASRDDGAFEQREYDDVYEPATSLTPATSADEPHSYIEGGWSA